MRSARSTSARPSRNWGEISGATFTTLPSGVTISEGGLVETTQGYPIYQPTLNNINMVAGVTQTGGTSEYISATGLGLNTLTSFIPNIVFGTTGVVLQGDYTICAFDHTNNTGVTVFLFDKSGATRLTGVSLHYVATGT